VARRPDSPTYDGTPSFGSGPSTIADRRPRHTVKKASAVSVAEPAKEPVMKVASPKTSLELGASSTGSGASSSGDDAARTPSKWRAAAGSTASSGDEGCSSPDKRARLAIGDGDKAISGKSATGTRQSQVSLSTFRFIPTHSFSGHSLSLFPPLVGLPAYLCYLPVEFRGFLCAN
jgi:hypothetical protein